MTDALDWLRDELAHLFEQKAREYLKDPWQARNGYISVIHDRSPENRARYFAANATRSLSEPEQVIVLKLMELQRHAMLMFTSCGWFFDDISGIEAVQNLLYAARALQLAEQSFGISLEEGLLARLQQMKNVVFGFEDQQCCVDGLLNLDVPAHGEVDNGGSDVARVDRVVDERAGFGRRHVFRWLVHGGDGEAGLRVAALAPPHAEHHDE